VTGFKHGGWGTRLYVTWRGIRQRCFNPTELADVARRIGMNAGTLKSRIFTLGWTVDKAISEPLRPSSRSYARGN
jgi:hypothetical protein